MPPLLKARIAARSWLANKRGSVGSIFAVVDRPAVAAALAAWLSLVPNTPIVARSPIICQDFDGPDSVWRIGDGQNRIASQERVPGGARSNDGCERIVVAGPVAQSILLFCPVTQLAVLDELDASIWVKASRPDIQFAARIMMPRSTGRDGQPAVAIVRGAGYQRVGHWQQLALQNVPDLLADEVRILRATPGAQIDPREAYVDAIALVVPGEPNGVEIFTDQLVIDGVPSPELRNAPEIVQVSFPPPAVQSAPAATPAASPAQHETGSMLGSRETANPAPIRLHGSVLMVDGKPFMPRVIPWHDEPLDFLAKCGFNTVQLSEPPNAELATEAKRHGLWFICPAPRPDAIGDGPVGRSDDRVLAWLLEDAAIELDPAYGRIWAALVRQRDVVRGRPIVVAPQGGWDAAANSADILMVDHPRAGRLAPVDYDRWFVSRSQLVQQGVPLWAAVAAQFGEQVGQQSNELAETLAAPPDVDATQLEMLVQLACVRGCRGVVVRSSSALNEDTSRARHRAGVLELLNHRLQLLEPWIAGGKVVGQIESTNAPWTGVMLLVDRARLLVPVPAEMLAGDVKSVSPDKIYAEMAFVVPGIPESCQVYWLSPLSLRPLATERVAGGTRIVLPARQAGVVLLTEDPKVVQTFRQHVAESAPTTVRLMRNLVDQEAKRAIEILRELKELGYSTNFLTQSFLQAEFQLRQCDALLASGRLDSVYELVEQVDRNLQHSASELRNLVSSPSELVSHPLALGFDQLLDYGRFPPTSTSLRGGENRLYGGDFEDLGQITQFGWQHVADDSPGIETRVSLTANGPHHGRQCLEISASRTSPMPSAALVNNAPVWVVAHPIPVEQGQIIEISGWVRVDEPIQESIDGLEIVDSLGGRELALTVRQTAGWQHFQIIRGVPESTELRVTFALTGLGKAQIDGVMVRELTRPVPRRLPPVSPIESPIGPNTADNSGPLFVAPGAR
jgi:hypothetical protein